MREKKTQEEIEKEEIEELFKSRIEFKQWNIRMWEIYIDICDSDNVEVSKEWFLEFLNNDE